jgi:hypothetical protein
MANRKTYTTDLMPEDAVPSELADKDLYRQAGGACRDCDFVTPKKGFHGRQALRAHMKKHVRDRRAWQRPFIKQLLVVGVLLGLAIAGWLDSALPFDLPFETPLVNFPADIARWAVVGSSTLLLMLSVLFMTAPGEVGGRALARLLGLCVLVGSIAGLWGVMTAWDWVTPVLWWPMQMPVWALVVITPFLAGKSGRVRLLVRRRAVKSQSYVPLVQPKNETARIDIQTWWERLRRLKSSRGTAAVKCPGCGKGFAQGTKPRVGRCSGCWAPLEAKPRVGGGLIVRRLT